MSEILSMIKDPFDYIDETIKKNFPNRPESVNHVDWDNHIFGISQIILELYALLNFYQESKTDITAFNAEGIPKYNDKTSIVKLMIKA